MLTINNQQKLRICAHEWNPFIETVSYRFWIKIPSFYGVNIHLTSVYCHSSVSFLYDFHFSLDKFAVIFFISAVVVVQYVIKFNGNMNFILLFSRKHTFFLYLSLFSTCCVHLLSVLNTKRISLLSDFFSINYELWNFHYVTQEQFIQNICISIVYIGKSIELFAKLKPHECIFKRILSQTQMFSINFLSNSIFLIKFHCE